MDPMQVDDVLEVPAHEDIDSGYGRDGDVLGINSHPFADHVLCDVDLGEFSGLRVESKSFDVRFRNLAEVSPHPVRSRCQLLKCEV